MEQYNKDLRERFEEEQKTSYALQGEHILHSWDYVFWIEAGIHKLQNTAPNSEYKQCLELIKQLSDDERENIFAEFCTHCGSSNPQCQCWNDE